MRKPGSASVSHGPTRGAKTLGPHLCQRLASPRHVVVFLHHADTYPRPTRRLLQGQKGIEERALMASQRPFSPLVMPSKLAVRTHDPASAHGNPSSLSCSLFLTPALAVATAARETAAPRGPCHHNAFLSITAAIALRTECRQQFWSIWNEIMSTISPGHPRSPATPQAGRSRQLTRPPILDIHRSRSNYDLLVVTKWTILEVSMAPVALRSGRGQKKDRVVPF